MSVSPTQAQSKSGLEQRASQHVEATNWGQVVVNTTTGETGDISRWIDRFRHVWENPLTRLEPLLSLLSPDVLLIAPTVPPRSLGRFEARLAFQRALRAMPDLRAEVHNWSATGDVLFVEMTFSATIGKRLIRWRNVDRFKFKGGEAIERVAHFDPSTVRRAYLSSPSAFLSYLRLRWAQ